LFNVVKHAQVAEATVALKRVDGQIVIAVSDRGQGMKPGVFLNASDGFGLASIRERLRLFNSHMQIESVSGQGTQVTITCPL
jgi:signal transduction histidine kinase